MNRNYPSDWDRRRKKVYQRDNYSCQNCGRTGGPRGSAKLHAHHVVPKSKGGSHKLSNLQTVCAKCHSKIHDDRRLAPSSNAKSDSKSPTPENITQEDILLFFGSLILCGVGIGILQAAPGGSIWGAVGLVATLPFGLIIVAFFARASNT